MRIEERDHDLLLQLSRAEFALLRGCVNETIEAVDDWEFHARLGATTDDARALCEELARLADTLPSE